MSVPLFLRGVVEWLHIVVGIAWVGAHITFDFAILPGLLKRPAVEAKAANEAIVAAAQPLFMSGRRLRVSVVPSSDVSSPRSRCRTSPERLRRRSSEYWVVRRPTPRSSSS